MANYKGNIPTNLMPALCERRNLNKEQIHEIIPTTPNLAYIMTVFCLPHDNYHLLLSIVWLLYNMLVVGITVCRQ